MDPLRHRCLPLLPPQRRNAALDEMAVDACAYDSKHFLVVGAYSTYPSNWRLESYWGGEVGVDSVLYGICDSTWEKGQFCAFFQNRVIATVTKVGFELQNVLHI